MFVCLFCIGQLSLLLVLIVMCNAEIREYFLFSVIFFLVFGYVMRTWTEIAHESQVMADIEQWANCVTVFPVCVFSRCSSFLPQPKHKLA